MYFETRSIVLRDGAPAILRSPSRADAAQLLDYIVTACGETEYLLKYPEEITYTLEQEGDFLENVRNSPNDMMILCEVAGRVAGNCSLGILPHIKTRHRASLGIGIYREYWGRGIGTAMFEALIEQAKALGLHQLELEYIDGNDRGLGLYRKMGFEECARTPDAIRLKDGSLHDLVMMRRVLQK